MFTPLSKKLKGFTELKTHDPNINELAALLIGEKKVIYTNLKPSDKDYLEKICSAFKLKYSLLPKKPYEPTHKEGLSNLLIGTSQSTIAAAEKAWSNTLSLEWGMALGYPECCVQAYQDWNLNFMEEKDLVHYIWEKTKRNREPFSFYLNNTYNFFSRLCSKDNSGASSKETLADFFKLTEKNNPTNLPTLLPIIAWHPCSYRCNASFSSGQKIYSFLKEYATDFAKERKQVLSRPIVHFDKFKFLTLDHPAVKRRGATENILFSKTTPPLSILELNDETKEKQITIKNNRFVKANFRLAIKLNQPTIFLDFSA